MQRPCFLVLLVVLMTACAEVEVRPLKDTEKFGQRDYYETKGVRFFRPWPYLWITVGEKGLCQMSITYLPQMNQEYIITPKTGIGAVTMAPTLAQGWNLTALNTVADSKASEMVTAIGSLTGNAAKAAGGGFLLQPEGQAEDQAEAVEFGPGLYRIVFDEKGYISPNLETIFLQKGPDQELAKCKDVKPPSETEVGKPTPPPPPLPKNK